MDAKKIGAFIKMMREEKKMTIGEFAKAANLESKAIIEYEAGVKKLNSKELTNISKALQVPLISVIWGEKPNWEQKPAIHRKEKL